MKKAQTLALSNGHQWHLSAWIVKGKTTVFGVNSMRESVKFRREFKGNCVGYCAHAEMDCIQRAEKLFPLKGMDLFVTRFTKDGLPAISKPCPYCMVHIKAAGLRRVHYFDANGNWQMLKVKDE